MQVKRPVRIGNSLAVILDRPVRELLGIERDTELEITLDGDALRIRPRRPGNAPRGPRRWRASTRLFWYLPEGAELDLDDPRERARVVRQVMLHGTYEDVVRMLRMLNRAELLEAYRAVRNTLPEDVRGFWDEVFEVRRDRTADRRDGGRPSPPSHRPESTVGGANCEIRSPKFP